MKKPLVLALVLALVATTAFAGDKPGTKAASPEDATKAVMANLDAAIAKHSGKAVAELFADDITFVAPMGDGKLVKGKADVQKVHEAMFAGEGKDMVTKHTIENVRWIGKDHALVDCSVTITGMKMDMPPGAPAPAFHATALLVEQGGKWLIADARPYSIMPAHAPAAPAKK